MSRVLALVEGQTERAFLDSVLKPHLASAGIYLSARVSGKPGKQKGGVRPFASVARELSALLKQDGEAYLTTMFDYYGMPGDWPGLAAVRGLATAQIPATIESAITLTLRQELGDSGRIAERFIPYIQMHEFEALLFATPAVLATAINRPDLTNTFTDIVSRCNGCETIDNSPSTAPSKRIISVYPSYAKVSMGSVRRSKNRTERHAQSLSPLQ